MASSGNHHTLSKLDKTNIYRSIGYAYERLGLEYAEKAAECYMAVIKVDPNSPFSLYRLAYLVREGIVITIKQVVVYINTPQYIFNFLL